MIDLLLIVSIRYVGPKFSLSDFHLTCSVDIAPKVQLLPAHEPSPALPHEGDDLKSNGFFASICGALCRDNTADEETKIIPNANMSNSVITSQCKFICETSFFYRNHMLQSLPPYSSGSSRSFKGCLSFNDCHVR